MNRLSFFDAIKIIRILNKMEEKIENYFNNATKS